MKRIGIITLNGNYNFGNRLQNYALKKYLEKMNFMVDTIWFCNYKAFIKEHIKRIVSIVLDKRRRNFLRFTNKYLNVKYKIFGKRVNGYDNFIVGSDQVWNYTFPDFNETLFLNFSDYSKNVAYAASFGVNVIPDNYKKMYINGLNNIKYISVREDIGLEIVNNLTGKPCEVLIDPTLLLSKNEWDIIAKMPKNYDGKKYILCYFLGKMNDKVQNEIFNFANNNGYEIINLLDKNNKYYSSGPNEFLWLEKNAQLICTDSFHSSVFAFMYNKPFIIFKREGNEQNMYSRIDTLLSKFKIQNREYNGVSITKDNLNNDYKESYLILEKERKKSRDFLEKALIHND